MTRLRSRRRRRRRASAEEVVAEALERLAARPDLNAVITMCADEAIARARAGVEGPLAGVPLLVKDLIDTAGIRTTYASAIYRDHVPSAPRRPCAGSRPQGAIVVGKANADEFAWGVCGQNVHYGDASTRPRPAASPAARAAATRRRSRPGIVPLGLGTDTGGSLRMPAAACGVVGLKPALRRGARSSGVFPLAASFDTVGPIARTVADCALAHAVLTGTEVPEPRLRGLRVGVLTAHPALAPRRAGRARDERALAHADRLRELGAHVARRACRCPDARHVAGLLRRGRGGPRGDVPEPPRRVRPAASAPSSTTPPRVDAEQAATAAGRCARGAPRRARARRRPRALADARRRRAAAGRASTSSRCGSPSRPTRAPSATWAGRRSRSATCSSPAATRRSDRRRARDGARRRRCVSVGHARDRLHPRQRPRRRPRGVGALLHRCLRHAARPEPRLPEHGGRVARVRRRAAAPVPARHPGARLPPRRPRRRRLRGGLPRRGASAGCSTAAGAEGARAQRRRAADVPARSGGQPRRGQLARREHDRPLGRDDDRARWPTSVRRRTRR